MSKAIIKMQWTSFRASETNRTPDVKCEGKGGVTSVKLGGLIWGTAVADADGNLYVGSTNRRFYRISPSGEIVWTYKLPAVNDSLIDSAAALDGRGLVVVPGGDGQLHALDAKTGKAVWVKNNEDDVPASVHKKGGIVNSFEGNVQVGQNGLIYAGCDNDHMYCLDRNGKVVWKHKTGMMVWTCAALHRGVCYFGSLDGSVYACGPDGSLINRLKTGAEIKASPVVSDGMVYVGNTNGVLYCLTPKLDVLWKADIGRNIYATPVFYKNLVIAATLSGDVYALDAYNGTRAWRCRLLSSVCSTPALVNGVLVVATGLGKLVAVSPDNGAIIASRALASGSKRAINASPIVLPGLGKIAVGCYDGNMYYVPCTFYRDGAGRLLKEVSGVDTDRKPYLEVVDDRYIVTIRLVVPGFPEAAVAYNSVTVEPEVPYNLEVSADGNFVNLVPVGWDWVGRAFTVRISGKYYLQTENWVLDRLLFNAGTFSQEVSFRGPAARENVALPRTMDVSEMYMSQPAVLDTYIPAAMDAQGMRLYFGSGGKMLVVPAVPDMDGFVLDEDESKRFELDYESRGNMVVAHGRFRIAAMGGTIYAKHFRAYVELQPGGRAQGRFWSATSCMSIKGNNKAYSFSSDIVNQLCDIFMEMQAVGSFTGAFVA